MESRFNVVFDGKIQDGVGLEEVRENLLNLYKGNIEAVNKLMESSRVFIKKNLDQSTAQKYKTAFDKTGAVCEIADSNTIENAPLEMEKAAPEQQEIRESTAIPAETSSQREIGLMGQGQIGEDGLTIAGPAEDSAVNLETCAECGREFARDEMIPYHNSWICAACKPVFVQKMKEGVNLSTEREYGGFWIRFGAKFIDGLIIGAVNMIMNFALTPLLIKDPSTVTTPAEMMAGPMIIGLVQMMTGAAYAIFFLGRFSATPGKMVCKLKVVTVDGENISYGRATGRFFGEFLSAITLYIGYLMAAFDSEKRALHDKVCGTRVVKV